jgi:tetratricopeptide (TPR) repeat protein
MNGQIAEAPSERQPVASGLTSRLRQEASRYQRVLERNPREPQALVGMSLIALASGQAASAVLMAQAAVAVAPAMGPAWVALGQALRAESRNADAEKAYMAAARIDGMDPLARLGLGEVRLAGDRPEDAIIEFDLALHRDPGLVSAHLGMGHALVFTKRYSEALASYGRALQLNPRLSEAEFAVGYTLARLGRAADAERRYRRAIALRPDFAAAWMNLGCLLREEGRELHARAALENAVRLRPSLVAAWINLALLEREYDRHEQAESHLRRALAINPEQVETHVAWAQFCAARGDAAGARGWVRWALARDESNDEAVNLEGILLHNEGRFREAVAVFERAEALGSAPAASNRGNSLLELGRERESLKAHRSAVASDPHNAGARYNLALTQLRMGEWPEGWRNYEARWRFREVHPAPRTFEQPRWRGQALRGERVLLHAEQGLGDTIQFSRYAALVSARGGVPILQVQAPVERLIRSLAVVRAGQAEVAPLGQPAPAFDLECPLMSLPAAFATTTATVPWPGAYLSADPDGIAAKRIPAGGNRPRIGLAWAGNPNYKADRERSVHLATYLPLLGAHDACWVSLQKGPAAEQIAELAPDVQIIDACSDDADLADTAAVVATLDLVITTDTSIAHLAGAMARPVWILLPHLADWRWMQKTVVTPWYPTARLFRQPSKGNWQSVLEAAISSLREARF